MATRSPLSNGTDQATQPSHSAQPASAPRAKAAPQHTVATVTGRARLDLGRVGFYATLGAGASAVPLPWVPDSLGRRVRGALVHDVAVRHGLSLTREAREVLCSRAGVAGARQGLFAQAVRFLGLRVAARMLMRLGPVAALGPAYDVLRIWTLGHLWDRYLGTARDSRAVRVDAEEARHVRAAIDRVIVHALRDALRQPGTPVEEPTVIDDQRDAATAFIDGLLGAAAGLPTRLVARLEAAFDELIAQPW